MLQKIVAAGIATLALGMLSAAEASADNRASGALMHSEGGEVGHFEFDPVGEKVRVYDAQPDDWGMLVELWWGGKRKGCGKRKHMWAGPSSNGCQFAPKGWPCGYGGPTGTAQNTLDFRGEA